jgi:hypothetical protein
MKILVACEFSGIVRDAFIARGHNAISCDYLPTQKVGPHYQGDVEDILYDDWDLMIAHPPCTHICVSGNRHWVNTWEREVGLDFVLLLFNAPIPRICIENPLGIISTRIRKPDQYIQPYEFGHPESKLTGLWLKDLPPLRPTKVLKKPVFGYWENQILSGQNALPPSADRWKLRSRTYSGVAKAMATQWGSFNYGYF